MGPVAHYLDASVLVALLTIEPFTSRADEFVRSNRDGLIVGDFAAAEFASALARRVRMRELTVDEGRDGLNLFDAWAARFARWERIEASDIASATAFLRRLDLPLRTPDALNIAIAQRLGATLVTFDHKMAAAARALGMAVAMP